MSRNLSEEQLIRSYFLGDLPESEEDRIQERAFTEPEFYEALLMIEGELVDGYALGLISEQERVKLERGFLMSPHQYQKVRVVRILEQYISDTHSAAVPIDKVERPSLLSRLVSVLKSKPLVLEPKRMDDSQRRAGDTWERPLKEAHANRELLLSLADDDWLGARLLSLLKSNPLSTKEHLLSHLENDHAKLDIVLGRLIECGLIERLNGRYSCSWFGSEILVKMRKLSDSHLGL